MVDVTKTKAQDTSHGPVLSVADRQAQDDSWLGRMFSMTELHLRISGRPTIDKEMATLAKRYPLTDSAMYMWRMGSAFQEQLDDDEAMVKDMGGDDEEDELDDAAMTLMAIDDATTADDDDA